MSIELESKRLTVASKASGSFKCVENLNFSMKFFFFFVFLTLFRQNNGSPVVVSRLQNQHGNKTTIHHSQSLLRFFLLTQINAHTPE